MAASTSTSSVSGSRGSTPNSQSTGFKVYGSVFKVSSRYQFLNPLGKGSYGVVCAAKDHETGQCVAIKKVTPISRRTVDAKHTLREVLLLQLLGKHPNIISIHNLSTNLKDDELYIVMDLMDTDMHRVIQSSQPLSDAHAKYFLHQLLRGVKYLHDNGVLHRDLKPGNLLLSKSCQLKIADFGLARKIPRVGVSSNPPERPRSAPAASSTNRVPDRPPMTEHVVTRWYRAPELMLQPDGLYDQSIDMWSVGCIFAEILGRKALFPGKNFLHQLTLIFDVVGAPSPEATANIQSSQAQRFLHSLGKRPKVPFRSLFPKASDSALDLLDRLLEFDPAKRISAQEALNHPYMQDIERKYRSRGGGVDPAPTRVDFSFDLKNLSKVDLRALLVKEVDNHRKANSTQNASARAGEENREDQPAIEKNSPSASTANDTRPISASTATSGVRISKIHATLRQAQIQDQQERREAPSTRHHLYAAKLGSNRRRIRAISKPPVPKQQDANVMVSNQHEHVRVVPAQVSLLSESLTSRVSPPSAENASNVLANTQKQNEVPESVPAQPEATVHSSTTPGSPKLQSRTSLSVHTTIKAAVTRKSNPMVPDKGASDAIAAAIALGERSKALITSLAKSAKTPEPIASTHIRQSRAVSYHSQAWRSKRDQNPESSSSSSSISSLPSSSPQSNKCQPVSRSNRPGSAFLTRSRKIQAEERTSESTATARPRRVSSAGPTRSKHRAMVATGSLTARSTNNSGTYVGSINSLIQAQRSNTGQSLAESANTMLATMNNCRQQEASGSREENASSSGHLKPQRSSSRLPGAEPTGRKHPSKRLTVPRSPKFSVMSWQKKREGVRVPGYAPGLH